MPSNVTLDMFEDLIILTVYRLLDMGYEKDVSKIIAAVDSQSSEIKRQTVLLSATLSEGQLYPIYILNSLMNMLSKRCRL